MRRVVREVVDTDEFEQFEGAPPAGTPCDGSDA